MKKPFVLIVSGPTGAGKTELVKWLLMTYPKLFKRSISATTRPERPGEVGGRDYHFLSREEFQARIELGDFLEYAVVHGEHLYGTLVSSVVDVLDSGISPVLTIDVQGHALARKIPAISGDIFSVFITVSDVEVLVERLRRRGDTSEADIRQRLKSRDAELREMRHYNAHLYNDGSLEMAQEQFARFLGL